MPLFHIRRCATCISAFLVVIATLSSCTGTDVPYAFDDFVNDLRRAGVTVELPPNAMVDQGFSISGRRIVANGEDLYVHEFSNGIEAIKAASTVSLSGYTIMTTQVDWREPPHFYRRDRLIVIYAGRDAGFKNLLGTLLSPPFAGSETDYRGQ